MRRIVVIRYLFVFVVGLAIAFGEDQPREAKGRDKQAAKEHPTAVPAGASEISPVCSSTPTAREKAGCTARRRSAS
jgi:hypothetical protein